jgi:hypothetical protein
VRVSCKADYCHNRCPRLMPSMVGADSSGWCMQMLADACWCRRYSKYMLVGLLVVQMPADA